MVSLTLSSKLHGKFSLQKSCFCFSFILTKTFAWEFFSQSLFSNKHTVMWQINKQLCFNKKSHWNCPVNMLPRFSKPPAIAAVAGWCETAAAATAAAPPPNMDNISPSSWCWGWWWWWWWWGGGGPSSSPVAWPLPCQCCHMEGADGTLEADL